MRKIIVLVFLSLISLNCSAQKIDKVRKVETKSNPIIEITPEEIENKKKHAARLIKLGYNDKSIMLQTRLTKKDIKVIRKKAS